MSRATTGFCCCPIWENPSCLRGYCPGWLGCITGFDVVSVEVIGVIPPGVKEELDTVGATTTDDCRVPDDVTGVLVMLTYGDSNVPTPGRGTTMGEC